jgi:hypothetical protein
LKTTTTNPIGFITLLIVFGMILSITWVNVILISSAYGQTAFPQFPMTPFSNTSGTNLTTKPSTQPSSAGASQLSSSSVEHGVRITSPTKGQQVPTGILTISGVSKDNATSDCNVNVIVNHVRPYQNTSATGPGGANDYSNWTFSLTPKYTLIKQGENQITSKFFCNPNPDIASFYSVNVTGVLPRPGVGLEGRTPSAIAITNSSNTTAAPNQNTNNSNG